MSKEMDEVNKVSIFLLLEAFVLLIGTSFPYVFMTYGEIVGYSFCAIVFIVWLLFRIFNIKIKAEGDLFIHFIIAFFSSLLFVSIYALVYLLRYNFTN